MTKKILLTGNRSREMYIFRKGIIEALSQEGYILTIVTPDYDKLSCDFFNRHGKNIQTGFNKKTLNPFSNLWLCYKLYRIYQSEKPDLIIHYTIKPNIWGSIAAHFAKIKSIAITTGLGYAFLYRNLSTFIIKILYKIALSYSCEVWFLNEDDKQVFLQKKLRPPNKAVVIPGEGISTGFFQIAKDKIKKDQIIRFLMIARLIIDKGTKEYCEAAQLIRMKYPYTEFQILGELNPDNIGSIDPEYIFDLHKREVINYLGTSDDVRKEIKDADCIVLPSYYREGVPRTLMEGASMAKALITTNNVGCKEVVIDSVNGFLCRTKDSNDLAEKMEKFILLPEDKKIEMGISGRQYMIKRFDEKIIIKIYLQKIRKIINNYESMSFS